FERKHRCTESPRNSEFGSALWKCNYTVVGIRFHRQVPSRNRQGRLWAGLCPLGTLRQVRQPVGCRQRYELCNEVQSCRLCPVESRTTSGGIRQLGTDKSTTGR